MNYLLDNFEPTNYKLNLNIDKHTKTLSGAVTITGQVKADVFALHAVDMTIDTITVNDCNYDGAEYDGQELHFANLADKQVEIVINYHKALNENMEGAYLSTYQHEGREERIVTTQFESHYAREAFPCIDEPAAKATFDLTITIPDEEDLILANTPATSIAAKNGSKTVVFETTPRMSTYLLAFIVGRFHGKTIANSHGVEITTYAPLNQPLDSVDFANEVAARSLDFYDDEFGIKYPLAKCDQVAIPDFEAGAMENWGLVTYRESMLLADKTATVDTKKSIALTVSHELSHQWFGDLVTMQWWDDLWLNESFASIMEYMATDAIYPEFNIWENFFTSDCIAALNRDAYTGVQSVHQAVANPAEIATLFDSAIVYAKGARLMLMLIRSLGWDNFKKGIKDYFTKYAYQNTIGDNLWDALSKYADFDVKTFMHAWIDQPGYPVLTDGKQQKFRLDGPLEPANWPIPHLSSDMAGHYVLNLNSAEFAEKLAHFNTLTLEERLRLLIDRNLIAKTPLAPSVSLLELISKFKTENSAAVWNIIATIIGGLKIFFTPDSEDEKRFKNFVKDLISDKLSELMSLKTLDDNQLRLRGTLLSLDFYAEDVENLRQLASQYSDNYGTLDPELREDILAAKLYLEPAMFDTYLEKYQATADPEIKFDIFIAMTLSKDATNVDKLIDLLSRPDIVKPQDHLYLYIYLYRNPKASEKAFDWLVKNWDYTKSLAGDKTIESYPRYTANAIKSQAAADTFWQFFNDKKSDPSLTRALEVADKEISARLDLISRDGEAVRKWCPERDLNPYIRRH